MAYKNIEHNFFFADFAYQSFADKNRKGERASIPLFLFKCFLPQKWFQIKPDPELESQINDRIFFNHFLIYR